MYHTVEYDDTVAVCVAGGLTAFMLIFTVAKLVSYANYKANSYLPPCFRSTINIKSIRRQDRPVRTPGPSLTSLRVLCIPAMNLCNTTKIQM